jgi:hypothetical protein
MENFLDDPYQNIGTIEYKLSIPPSKVIDIVKEQTEILTSVQRYLPFSEKNNVKFWSKFSGDDIFRVLQKWNAKGYSSSFAPWLVGWVKPAKEGCSVRIFFEMDERVTKLNQRNFYMFMFFTIIIGLIFISDVLSGTLSNKNTSGLVAIVSLWAIFYGIRKIGFHLGQQDKTALLEFIESLFVPYKVQ